jgi:hypothetical protein
MGDHWFIDISYKSSARLIRDVSPTWTLERILCVSWISCRSYVCVRMIVYYSSGRTRVIGYSTWTELNVSIGMRQILVVSWASGPIYSIVVVTCVMIV